VLNEISND
jgi:hypothetical protein